MKNFHSYVLTGCLIVSSIAFSGIGMYEQGELSICIPTLQAEELPFVYTMNSIHDGTLFSEQVIDEELEVPLSDVPEQPEPVVNTIIPYTYRCEPFKEGLLKKCLLLHHLGIPEPYEFVNHGIPNKNSLSINHLLTKNDFVTYIDRHTKIETYSFSAVDESYFDNAVFLGDSRTVGIRNYSGITNASFLCDTSLTIFDYDKKKIPYDNQKITIRDALKLKQYEKVYIMFGINECGYYSTQDYLAKYHEVISDIRSLQPDALIFIEASLSITEEKSKKSKYINNENLFERNKALETLANQHDIFYIDINQSELCNEDGSLISEYTWDQVHIKAEYYSIWKDYILKHGIVVS